MAELTVSSVGMAEAEVTRAEEDEAEADEEVMRTSGIGTQNNILHKGNCGVANTRINLPAGSISSI